MKRGKKKMSDQIINPVIFGILIAILGFMIKKWVFIIETKLDKISASLGHKMDREDFFNFAENLEKKCDKREKMLEHINENKCNEIDFIKHSHTTEGKIILN